MADKEEMKERLIRLICIAEWLLHEAGSSITAVPMSKTLSSPVYVLRRRFFRLLFLLEINFE